MTGDPLWHIGLGLSVKAAPITYRVDGRQYVTIAAGNVVHTFGLHEYRRVNTVHAAMELLEASTVSVV